MPMSSPQMTRMLGLSVFAMMTSMNSEELRKEPLSYDAQPHRGEREDADERERDGDHLQRRVADYARGAGHRGEVAKQVGLHLSVLPQRDQNTRDARTDQREPE